MIPGYESRLIPVKMHYSKFLLFSKKKIKIRNSSKISSPANLHDKEASLCLNLINYIL